MHTLRITIIYYVLVLTMRANLFPLLCRKILITQYTYPLYIVFTCTLYGPILHMYSRMYLQLKTVKYIPVFQLFL